MIVAVVHWPKSHLLDRWLVMLLVVIICLLLEIFNLLYKVVQYNPGVSSTV